MEALSSNNPIQAAPEIPKTKLDNISQSLISYKIASSDSYTFLFF